VTEPQALPEQAKAKRDLRIGLPVEVADWYAARARERFTRDGAAGYAREILLSVYRKNRVEELKT
jgi:hypothetical protein